MVLRQYLEGAQACLPDKEKEKFKADFSTLFALVGAVIQYDKNIPEARIFSAKVIENSDTMNKFFEKSDSILKIRKEKIQSKLTEIAKGNRQLQKYINDHAAEMRNL